GVFCEQSIENKLFDHCASLYTQMLLERFEDCIVNSNVCCYRQMYLNVIVVFTRALRCRRMLDIGRGSVLWSFVGMTFTTGLWIEASKRRQRLKGGVVSLDRLSVLSSDAADSSVYLVIWSGLHVRIDCE